MLQLKRLSGSVLFAENVICVPPQTLSSGKMLKPGFDAATTVIVVLAVSKFPQLSVAITVYVVVEVGQTFTMLPVRFPGCHT